MKSRVTVDKSTLDTRTLDIDGALKRIEGKLVKGKTKNEASNRTIALPTR